MKGPTRPWCANCGSLTVDADNRIVAHHCVLSNAPDWVFWAEPRPVTVNRPTPLSIRQLLKDCSTSPITAALGLGLLALLWAIGWL